ncbi:glucoside xylosyltransferase 1 [Condylostylus longicornis]|uniref:glucoside xylosyltransferase 1 n=1 Tax=Condylostylus longicornis TaxID=2530218 RepID=UPI00244DEE65|nr:glucoside xylosyltransferase 1 [Condylostylus longicornis]
MRNVKKFLLYLLVTLCIIFYILFHIGTSKDDIIKIMRDRGKSSFMLTTPSKPIITIAAVSCGERLKETLNMLKSVLLFNVNGPHLKFVIVAEESLHIGFQEKLGDWQEILPGQFSYELHDLKFPMGKEKEWKSLFKPCAAQRLFLPSLLQDIDSVLYLDTDTVFLSPVSEIWSLFKDFNATQIAGLSPEHEDKNVGWYNRFAHHPYYGELGVNSGVMLMNLTRMRDFHWEDHILPIHDEYKLKIIWGDQDLINILFYFHPEKLYVFPCEFNYRPDHCMYQSICNASNGVRIMHGNRGYFHSDKQPLFSAVYRAIESYELGKDPYKNFLMNLESDLEDEVVVNSNCGKVEQQVLLKAKKIFVAKDYYYYN